MAAEDTFQSLKRLLTRAHEYWLPEDVDSFHSAFQAVAIALDTIAQYSFKFEDEPAYPTTIRLLKYNAENHD
jgi:hypothetical protein